MACSPGPAHAPAWVGCRIAELQTWDESPLLNGILQVHLQKSHARLQAFLRGLNRSYTGRCGLVVV